MDTSPPQPENMSKLLRDTIKQLEYPDVVEMLIYQAEETHLIKSDDTVVVIYQKRKDTNRVQAIASAHDMLAIEYESIATDSDRKLRASDEYIDTDISNLLPAAIHALQNMDTMNLFLESNCGIISLRVPETHVLVLPTDIDESFAKSMHIAACVVLQAYDQYVEEHPDEAI